MQSESAWKLAPTPNYSTNVDKKYPYSEEPYSKQYHLIKIPTSSEDLIDHVSYWGEGRIVSDDNIIGFADCYNVNHQYQLVSKGPDTNRRIPNRVPVESYEHCDTGNYIKDNSVKLVTVMGGRINKSCAEDVARIIKQNTGRVIVFGRTIDSQDVRTLDEELKSKELYYCPEYDLPESLQRLITPSFYRAYLNVTELKDQLTNFINKSSYANAVELSRVFNDNYHTLHFVQIVLKLLQDRSKNLMSYVYQVCRASEQMINYFPPQFKVIFNQSDVKIINKKDNLALKLDAHVDSYNDRLAWGDRQDKSSGRVKWQLIPVWEDNKVLFKIKNIEHGMFLKLDVKTDSYGDRKCWGSNSSNESRHRWSLEPVKQDDEILFLIINHGYNQGLKLDSKVDSYGDRLLWGHNGAVRSPEYFGWKIKPFHEIDLSIVDL